MKKLRILTHGPSNSLNSLVDLLRSNGVDVKKIKLLGSTYRGTNQDHVILNWGSTNRSNVDPSVSIVNDPTAVMLASNKISTFTKLAETHLGGNIPIWSTNYEDALDWVNRGQVVYCRTLIRASQGRGIVVARTEEELVSNSPLFTVKVPRNREIRVHVFGGEVIDFCQKKKMNEERIAEDGLTYSNDVRSHGNGWVFSRDGVTIPDSAKRIAIDAVSALGLQFGSCDMALNLGAPKIFEINTAPGLEGTTLQRFYEHIISLLQL